MCALSLSLSDWLFILRVFSSQHSSPAPPPLPPPWLCHCPAFLRLLPGFRRQAKLLPGVRQEICKKVRDLVKKYGPELGALYYEKTNAWEATIPKRQSSEMDLVDLAEKKAR